MCQAKDLPLPLTCPTSPDTSPWKTPTFRGKPTFEFKVSTLLSTIATLLMLPYYLCGSHFVPLCILLPVAGQVLSRGVVAINDFFVHWLGRISQRCNVPLDLLTSSIMEMDTRTGRKYNLSSFLVGGFVMLFMVNTPEVLLGTLATGHNDIRETGTERGKVELASFGGGFNNTTYYTSGLLLMSSTDPWTAYGEIGYRLNESYWVVPRKPTLFYARFAEAGSRWNDFEKRVWVPNNEVVVLRKIPRPVDEKCSILNATDFKYFVKFYTCTGGKFGFEAGGPNLKRDEGFFSLTVGHTHVHYSSINGNRIMRGGEVFDDRPVNFPRHEKLWADMGYCFLNAVSFNRISSSMKVSERFAISSLVRIAGLDHPSGFSHPPAKTDAELTSVMCANVPFWVIVIMVVSVVLMWFSAFYFRFNLKVLSRELGQWIQISNSLSSSGVFGSLPRYAQSSQARSRNIKVSLQTVVVDGSKEIVLVPVPRNGHEDRASTDLKDDDIGSVSSYVSRVSSGDTTDDEHSH